MCSFYITGDEDAIEIKFIVLNKGEPRQCGCGKWFKLIPVKLEDS